MLKSTMVLKLLIGLLILFSPFLGQAKIIVTKKNENDQGKQPLCFEVTLSDEKICFEYTAQEMKTLEVIEYLVNSDFIQLRRLPATRLVPYELIRDRKEGACTEAGNKVEELLAAVEKLKRETQSIKSNFGEYCSSSSDFNDSVGKIPATSR